MIELKQVSKTYVMGKTQLQALQAINLRITAHELVAIIGPSGSGKSTLMHLMGLLDRPTRGDYYLDGKPTSSFSRNEQAYYRNQYIGFVFQSFFLLPRLTALENVALPLLYRRVGRKDSLQRAEALLSKVGMTQHLQHKPHELSGGQQQRVAIARALVGAPRLILADEPTGALDTQTGKTVMELLVSCATDAAVVIITHDPNIAAQCHRQITLLDGKMVTAT